VLADGLVADVDARLIEILLENVLGNAWKFTAQTSAPRIELDALELDGERVFRLRDNGAGFDPAQTNRLFTPFQRLHAQEEFSGTGVGLATVKRIVEHHGGRVWIEGAPGLGACVYWTLRPPPRPA